MTDPRDAATKWYKRIHDAVVTKLNEGLRAGTRRVMSEEQKVILAQLCLPLGDLDARDASKTDRLNRLEERIARLERQQTRFDAE